MVTKQRCKTFSLPQAAIQTSVVVRMQSCDSAAPSDLVLDHLILQSPLLNLNTSISSTDKIQILQVKWIKFRNFDISTVIQRRQQLTCQQRSTLMVSYEGCNRPVGVGEGFASKLEQRHMLFRHQLGKDALKMVVSWSVKVLASTFNKDKSSSR